MTRIRKDSITSAQILYLRRLTYLKERLQNVVDTGKKDMNLEESIFKEMDNIDIEIDDISGYLKILSYLQRS